LLSNLKDHECNERSRHQPIVCNTRRVAGVEHPALLGLLQSHLPIHFGGRALLDQVHHVLHAGLMCHGDEFINLAMHDKRHVLGFHAAPSAQWHRENGNGVALAGLGKNGLRASLDFRRWILCLNVLISHVFLDRFLSSTSRLSQGMPCEIRQGVRQAWLEHQTISREATTKNAPRLADAMSLTAGMTVFHFDGLNDSRPDHDNISLGMSSIEDWAFYVSSASLKKLEQHGLATKNTAFTALAHQRAVNGSMTDWMRGVADASCPLFCEIVKLIKSNFPFDPAPIHEANARLLFRSAISVLPMEQRNRINYWGRHALTPEGNNQFTFLGTIVVAWIKVIEEFYLRVTHCHSEVFVSFCMREINGSPLICGILQRLVEPASRSRTEAALASADVCDFYILLSTVMFEMTGCQFTVNCSKRNRWQNVDKPLWDGTAEGRRQTLICLAFTKCQFSSMHDQNTQGNEHDREMLTSKRHWEKHCSPVELKVAKLGAARGTFGIQLSAWMLISTPSSNAGFASMEKGGSGFHKFVNCFKQREHSGCDLTSAEAQDEVGRLLVGLRSSGFKVDNAFLDHSGCLWWRLNGTEGEDNRKMDILLFEKRGGRLHAPMGHRVFSSSDRCEIQFFVHDKWCMLRNYLCPGFELSGGNRSTPIRRQQTWTHGPTESFRDKECLLSHVKSVLSVLFLFGAPSMFPSSVQFWCVNYDLFSGRRPCVVRQRCHRWSALCGFSCRCSGRLTVPMSFVSGAPTMPSLVRPRWVCFVAACGV
jgi:hypothetical protein